MPEFTSSGLRSTRSYERKYEYRLISIGFLMPMNCIGYISSASHLQWVQVENYFTLRRS